MWGRDLKRAAAHANRSLWLPLTALAAVNLATFFPHYLGRMTFPWDFLAGYHAHTFGWYRAGSLLSPPAWLPWSDLGFPAFLAVQAGAWYLPLAAVDAVGLDYTIRVATVVQCLHVLAGAVGAFFLFRRLGFCLWTAFMGGLAYHFTAAFFSGQQFVDIVRAAALLPWLWLALHPHFLTKSFLSPVLASLLLWQFLVAAYPGNIVSTAYGSIVVCLVAVFATKTKQARVRYVLLLGSVVTAATMMAMIKWYPVIAERSQLDYEAGRQSILHWKLLATLVVPYDVAFFPGDLAMRSLWLPLSLLLGVAFAKLRSQAEWVGCGLVTLTLAVAMIAPQVGLVHDLIPGARVSRFLVSDWRPIFQLGLILLALSGWTRLLARQYGFGPVVVRSCAMAGVLILAGFGLEELGYPASRLRLPFATILVVALLGIGVALLQRQGHGHGQGGARGRIAVIAVVCLLVAGEAAVYQLGQPVTWRAPWSQTSEILAYGDTLERLRHRPAALEDGRRPRRFALDATAEAALQSRRSLAYNRCWYAESYCVLGYNNLKMSVPHRRFADALVASGGEDLFAFVRRAQQLLLLPPDAAGLVAGLTAGNIDASAIGRIPEGTRIGFVDYLPGKVVYSISVPEPVLVVENEIWWSGWAVSYCNSLGCSRPTPARRTSQQLRSWPLEQGTWQVVLEYRNADSRIGYLLFLAGLLLSLMLPWAVSRLGPPVPPAGPSRPGGEGSGRSD